MSLHVDKNWWKDIFDEVYLLTDARSVCDDALTKREVNFLEKILLFDKSQSILDMCGGQGRHSLELSRRGFKEVTVLDYSNYLLNFGKNLAREEKLKTHFVQADARQTGFLSESFQHIIIMASSFGYFTEDAENQKILEEVHRLLKFNGTLLLDLPNREFVIQNFKSSSTHQINEDLTAYRDRELGNDIIRSREKVVSKSRGVIKDSTYCFRLFSEEIISNMLSDAGFSQITCEKDFMNRQGEEDYGSMTNRMIVVAHKGEL
jgi:D-alanine-D-alanine ligase